MSMLSANWLTCADGIISLGTEIWYQTRRHFSILDSIEHFGREYRGSLPSPESTFILTPHWTADGIFWMCFAHRVGHSFFQVRRVTSVHFI